MSGAVRVGYNEESSVPTDGVLITMERYDMLIYHQDFIPVWITEADEKTLILSFAELHG